MGFESDQDALNSIYLYKLPLPEGKLLLARVRVGRHCRRVVVEQRHEYAHSLVTVVGRLLTVVWLLLLFCRVVVYVCYNVGGGGRAGRVGCCCGGSGLTRND